MIFASSSFTISLDESEAVEGFAFHYQRCQLETLQFCYQFQSEYLEWAKYTVILEYQSMAIFMNIYTFSSIETFYLR